VKAAAVLAAYTLLLSLIGGRLLSRAAWPSRAPRWGIAAWQALSVSALLGASATGVALLVQNMRVSASLSGLFRECVMALRAQYRTPGGAASSAVGATLALLVLGCAAASVGRELLVASRARRTHRAALILSGRPWAAPACSGGRCARAIPLVVEHTQPVAYCLPGRGGRIVLSSAALAALDPAELGAVLAHERAHLAGRHHLVLAVAAGLGRAFWFVPLLRQAREQTAVLVEMLADDRASREGQPLTVASALLAVAAGTTQPQPVGRTMPVLGALGATETATGDRVRRLLAAAPPLRRTGRSIAAVASALLVMTPLVLLVTPALVFANTTDCPV
jgi:Zn-dependent protease with chaperone function